MDLENDIKILGDLEVDQETLEDAQDILQPFEKLLPIQVLDHKVYLPENNSLWRGLQFWGLIKKEVTIDFGLFCLAGTCKNCKAFVQMPGMEDREALLLCQTKTQAGCHIQKLPSGFRLKKAY